MKKLNFLFASLAIALVVALYCYAGSSKNNVSLLSENVEALASSEDNHGKPDDPCPPGYNHNQTLKRTTSQQVLKGKEVEVSGGAGYKIINGQVTYKYKERDRLVIIIDYNCEASSKNCCNPEEQDTVTKEV